MLARCLASREATKMDQGKSWIGKVRPAKHRKSPSFASLDNKDLTTPNTATMIRSTLIVGGLLVSMAAAAQSAPATPSPKADPKGTVVPRAPMSATPRVNDGFRGINIGVLIKRVGITTEQTQQVKELNGAYYKQHRDIPAEMPLEERKAQVTKMMAERETKLNAILTPEQQKQYAALNAEMEAKRIEFEKKAAAAPSPAPSVPTEKK
jgi:Spy/CpxP family protein refolding chaperone